MAREILSKVRQLEQNMCHVFVISQIGLHLLYDTTSRWSPGSPVSQVHDCHYRHHLGSEMNHYMAYTGQHKNKSTSIVAEYQIDIPDKPPLNIRKREYS